MLVIVLRTGCVWCVFECLRWFELLLFDLFVVFDVYDLLIVVGFVLGWLRCCMLILDCGV